jgi:FkbM family methyltransferase
VFDIGANLGNRSKIFLRLGARVIAFEPQARCCAFLSQMLGRDRRFRLVRTALGSTLGKATLFVGGSHTISSLSEPWINATLQSGRFATEEWRGREEVEITTLDSVIAMFGRPSFVKVDVEGFEYEVLKGLSRPVDAFSIEVTPEYIQNTYNCIELLKTFGEFHFQFSFGESMEFALPRWLSHPELCEWLKSLPPKSFGDLYARHTI